MYVSLSLSLSFVTFFPDFNEGKGKRGKIDCSLDDSVDKFENFVTISTLLSTFRLLRVGESCYSFRFVHPLNLWCFITCESGLD